MAAATIVDYFMKVEGVPGTSTDEGNKDAFEIKDFSFGVENKTTIGSATGGAGAGKVKFNEFTIKKLSDKASPIFFRNCVAGAHYKTVTLTMRKAGGDPGSAGKPFLMVKFSDVLTSQYTNTFVKPPPPEPPVDIIVASVDSIGGQLGTSVSGTSDEGPEESISFNYTKVAMASDPVTISVRPAATGVFAFDTKTGDWTLAEGGEGGLTVGTDGGVVHRAVQKFDVADLQGLLALNAGSLNFSVNEVRPTTEDPEKSPPDPNLHFDVILFQTDDSSIGPLDLKTEGKRIGSLHVDPRGDAASIDLDLTSEVREAALETIGIRLELRGAPVEVDPTNPNSETPAAPAGSDSDVVLKGRNILINFTTALSFDTK